LVKKVPVADNVIKYAVNLVSNSRPTNSTSPSFVKEWLNWGAGPRASQYLILAAKTNAILQGRATPDIDDVKNCAIPVLRHRLITNFKAQADSVKVEDIISRLI